MKFEVFIAEYLLVLITMATVLYITNELIKLVDTIRIMWVEHRVRKLCCERSQAPAKAKEKRIQPVHHEFEMPHFQWRWVWIALAAIAAIVLVVGIVGIIMYDPSGGR